MSVKATIVGNNQTILKLPHFTSVSSDQVKELTQFSELTVQLDIIHPSSDMFFAVDIKVYLIVVLIVIVCCEYPSNLLNYNSFDGMVIESGYHAGRRCDHQKSEDSKPW